MRWLPALAALVLAARDCAALFLPDSPELQRLLSHYGDESDRNRTGTGRARRGIEWSDRKEILKLHNKLRGGVYPSASNMEYMVWDDALEQSAARWAGECMWEHGPRDLLVSIGQNLAVHWGRYRSPAQQVHSWYDEVKDYTYPYSHECNPWCPERCSGSMCTHYTQLVWATTSRLGCAVRLCPRMNVWGEVWENAVYLVCNYSPKGNWIGEAPYKHGHPCSQCPPSYGGGCRENLCHKDPYTPQRPETEDMNEVEKVPIRPRTTTTKPSPKLKPKARPSVPKKASAPQKTPAPKKPSSKKPSKTKSAANPFLTQNINCEIKMRDKCKGARCNRYKCPANCQKKGGKLWGTSFYDVQSSICRAAIHSGAIDNNGGLVDITRKDKLPFFVKATKNGVESFSKYKPGNAFVVVKVKEQPVDCYTTVAEICAFKKPASTCPRVFCASNCKNEPSYWAPVIGTNIYADGSSICRAATHAGVIQASGGYVDVLPLDKKKSYMGSLRNGIQSESKSNWEGGSFSVFLVKE